ncbi:MAG TPA: GNAT family N-acetyltransferase [Ruminiclostridium sp.]|nr:GNAT family N-acetyltransferase [Ruminiclostridium sp.]
MSIYIAESSRGIGIGKALLDCFVSESEKTGFWMLKSGIMEDNEASLRLHETCGFRKVGLREKIGKDCTGKWRSTVLMGKRSQFIGIE